jgi:hypothetical protein
MKNNIIPKPRASKFCGGQVCPDIEGLIALLLRVKLTSLNEYVII